MTERFPGARVLERMLLTRGAGRFEWQRGGRNAKALSRRSRVLRSSVWTETVEGRIVRERKCTESRRVRWIRRSAGESEIGQLHRAVEVEGGKNGIRESVLRALRDP